MYVCICNALTERALTQAARASGTERPSDVYAACGCRAQCGNCVKAVLAMLRDAVGCEMEKTLQGAD